MTEAANLLDKVKKAKNWTSDYQCAKGLDISTQAVSKIRNGGGVGNDLAWKIAEILNKEPAEIIAEVEAIRAEKAGDQAKAAVWEARFQALAGSAPLAFLIAINYGREAIHSLCILCSIDELRGKHYKTRPAIA